MTEENASVTNPYKDSVEKLSAGLLSYYKEPLEKVENHLKELTSEQNKIIIQLHDENMTVAEQMHSPELQNMIKKMNTYHSKLLNIKKDMKQLHEKSSRLKTRALKLEQYTEKMRLKKIQKEIDLRKEEELIGSGPGPLSEKSKNEHT